ncbi:hypothetical protein XAC2852_790198 [Xanthomonas citri pv. citri]|nr:hypothetical protein XAC2852_790198 [Xanthomonas citri pv. citri]
MSLGGERAASRSTDRWQAGNRSVALGFLSAVVQRALLRVDVLLLAVSAALAEVGLGAAIAFRVTVGFAFAQATAAAMTALMQRFRRAVARRLCVAGLDRRWIAAPPAIHRCVGTVAAVSPLTFIVRVESGFLVHANSCAVQ